MFMPLPAVAMSCGNHPAQSRSPLIQAAVEAHVSIFLADFAIQFSQESAISQGIRPVMSREGIYTIPRGSSFGPDFLYNLLRLEQG
jgi:hypothetical protein